MVEQQIFEAARDFERGPRKWKKGDKLDPNEVDIGSALRLDLARLRGGDDEGELEPAGESDPETGPGHGGEPVLSLDELRARAEGLGIEVNTRWREARLAKEIATVEASSADNEEANNEEAG